MHRSLLCLGLTFLLSACAAVKPAEDAYQERVRINTQLALEKCGVGRVLEVTGNGFSCKQ
jgi:hypothetical protein